MYVTVPGKEETMKLRVTYGMVVDICTKDLALDRLPTAHELCTWAISGKGADLIKGLMTMQAADEILNHQERTFDTED